jgi:hypothetical protein
VELTFRRFKWLGAAAVIAALALSVVAQARQAAPRTVLTTQGAVWSLAVHGTHLAWIDAVWRLDRATVGSPRIAKTVYANQYSESQEDPKLVFAGGSPLWRDSNGSVYLTQRVLTLTPAGRLRVLRSVQHGVGVEGTYITDVVGSPAGGAYGIASMKQGTGPGKYVVVAGGIWVVADGSARAVASLPPPVLVARYGTRIAFEPVSSDHLFGAVLEVRNLAGGLARRISVPSSTVAELDASGSFAVIHSLHSVSAVDALRGQVAVVATTDWSVISTAVDGTTVAFVERRHVPGTRPVLAHPSAYTSRIVEAALP